jgi:hypothetical protein
LIKKNVSYAVKDKTKRVTFSIGCSFRRSKNLDFCITNMELKLMLLAEAVLGLSVKKEYSPK